MGLSASCPNCDFSFISKLDHDTCLLDCICTSCMSSYSILHPSSYGADAGNALPILQASRDGFVETGQILNVVASESIDGMVHYQISQVPCDSCGEFRLQIAFEPGDHCPKCDHILETFYVE